MYPYLKKNEPPPTLRAAVRLLRYVFIAAIHFPEFQRQFSTPNIPKFGLALVALADKQDHVEMRVRVFNLCRPLSQDNSRIQIQILETLDQLVQLYPTLHKPLHPSLSSVAMRFLNGSSVPICDSLLERASRLYSTLP